MSAARQPVRRREGAVGVDGGPGRLVSSAGVAAVSNRADPACTTATSDVGVEVITVDKKGRENYQLLLGGSEAADTSLGKITGPGFDEDGIVEAVEKAADVYLAQRADGERFLDTYRRIGMDPFKEALYG